MLTGKGIDVSSGATISRSRTPRPKILTPTTAVNTLEETAVDSCATSNTSCISVPLVLMGYKCFLSKTLKYYVMQITYMEGIFDIIIVGAGTGGAVAAITAARSGLDVCVIDAKRRENIGNSVIA